MIEIRVEPDYADEIKTDQLRTACRAALRAGNFKQESQLTLLVTSDAKIQSLNRDYLGNDLPTDVLSFPNNEVDPENGLRYLGDLVIALPFARRQAEVQKHALGHELELLAVHGSLHLLGFDHDTAENKAQMWSLQTEALQSLGNPLRPA